MGGGRQVFFFFFFLLGFDLAVVFFLWLSGSNNRWR